MNIFKNLAIYRLESSIPLNLKETIESNVAQNLGESSQCISGFASLGKNTDDTDIYCVSAESGILVKWLYVSRSVKKATVNALFNQRILNIEAKGGILTDDEKIAIHEQIYAECQKYSDIRRTEVLILIDDKKSTIYLNGGTSAKNEDALSFLRKIWGGLRVSPVNIPVMSSKQIIRIFNNSLQLTQNLVVIPDGKLVVQSQEDLASVIFDGIDLSTDKASVENLSAGMEILSMDVRLWQHDPDSQIRDLAALRLVWKGQDFFFKCFSYTDINSEYDDYEHELQTEILIICSVVPKIIAELHTFLGIGTPA